MATNKTTGTTYTYTAPSLTALPVGSSSASSNVSSFAEDQAIKMEADKKKKKQEFEQQAGAASGSIIPTQTGSGTFNVEGDAFMTGLGQSLGLESGQNILDTLVGERPGSVRDYYSDILQSYEDQSKGYTSSELENITGTKRQALAEQARRAGGGTSALKGGQRLEAAKKAQMGALMQQAAQVEAGKEASRGRAEAGKAGLAQLEIDIASQDRQRQMEFDTQRANIALQMYNLAEQRRIGEELAKKVN